MIVQYFLMTIFRLMDLEVQTKRGFNRTVGHGSAVTKITNSLIVYWTDEKPDVKQASHGCIETKVRRIINDAKSLMNQTRNLHQEPWTSDTRKSFMSIVNIAADETAQVSLEVSK